MAVRTAPPRLELASASDAQFKRKPQSFGSMALQSLRRDKLTILAMFVVLVLGLLALFAPAITGAMGVDPNSTNPDNSFQQPLVLPYLSWIMGSDNQTAAEILGKADGTAHWLGTDKLGRDQLARLLYGGRVSLAIAFSAAFISLILGVSVGAIAGYFGGIIDDVIMWFINTVSSIPTLYLLIIIAAIDFEETALGQAPYLGEAINNDASKLVLFLGFLGWFGTARFMRGNVFRVKELDYSQAAESLGAKNGRILMRHVIPNSIPVIIVITAIDVGGLILTESALSFLGLGVDQPTATWGSMLTRARNLFSLDPVPLHLMLWPGILISVSVLCFYLIGDGLRDALDPMLKNKK